MLQHGLCATAALALTTAATAQCQVNDFENFAIGTVATNLIPGVTITCPDNSCGSEGGLVLPEVSDVSGPDGTTKIVTTRQGCPDFSPDGLLLTFDENQSFIQFRLGSNLGIGGQSTTVRWYNQFGTPLGTRNYTTASGMGLVVTIETSAEIVRSVEINAQAVDYELIDDLVFATDSTPPTVEIDAPAFDACVCGDDVIGIVGAVDDPDGNYGCDRAEYRAINADASDPWTQFGQACGAFAGTLHSWNTTGIPEGRYYVRITGDNECGLSQSDTTVVRVDRSFHAIALAPVIEPLCGVVTIEGGVSDPCGLTWELHQRPVAGGTWIEIASGDSAVDCEIADWDTTTVADDSYRLRFRAWDGCDHFAQVMQDVIVDNSDGCGCTADLNGDGVVNFSDLIALLAAWTI